MGIDIYIMREKAPTKDDKAELFDINQGHVGYLREAYHGGPYATELLVPEAFKTETGKIQISAAAMRNRLKEKQDATNAIRVREAEVVTLVLEKMLAKRKSQPKPANSEQTTEPDNSEAHIVQEILNNIRPADMQEAIATLVERNHTLPKKLSVIEAVVLRNKLLYHHSDEEIEKNVQSFIDFVELAEKMEEEHGHPCTIYASH